jgi:MYXO-CTERM domain-containing protein
MTSQPSSRDFFALLFAAAALLTPSAARAANTCTQSSGCPKGFSCQVSEVTPPCPAIACAPGETCVQPACDQETISQCVPLPCTSDSDCASGMVCFAQTSQDCPELAVPPCPPDAKCATPDPAPVQPCTTTTTRSCVPKYLLPCAAASDCGDGFTCDPDEVGTCSGSGPAPSEDGGPVAPPEPPVCTTMTLSTSHCTAKMVDCTSSSDCPSGWSCEAQALNAATVECAGPTALDGGSSTVSNCDPGPTQPAQMLCTPPYAGLATGGSFGDQSTGLNGNATAAPEVAGDPPARSSTSSAGSANDGGCSVGSGRSRGAGSFLGLLGLVGLALRRRRPR